MRLDLRGTQRKTTQKVDGPDLEGTPMDLHFAVATIGKTKQNMLTDMGQFDLIEAFWTSFSWGWLSKYV